MIWNLIGSIGGKVLDIVDDVVEDKDEANKLKFQIQKQLLESKSSELEAQAKQRDSSWKLRHELGHKVEGNPKAYTRKFKHLIIILRVDMGQC